MYAEKPELTIGPYLARVDVRGVEGITRELDAAAAADVLAALHEEGVVGACTATKVSNCPGPGISSIGSQEPDLRATSQMTSDEMLGKDILSYVTSYSGGSWD